MKSLKLNEKFGMIKIIDKHFGKSLNMVKTRKPICIFNYWITGIEFMRI